MAGYKGWSMSWNAVDSYDNGEKPYSKWNKREIVEDILDTNEKIDVELLKKLNIKILKEEFLELTSWHHTSKFYNQTNFYSIDYKKIERLTNDDLIEIHNRSLIGKSKGQILSGKKGSYHIVKRKRVRFFIKADIKDYRDYYYHETIEGFKAGEYIYYKDKDGKWNRYTAIWGLQFWNGIHN